MSSPENKTVFTAGEEEIQIIELDGEPYEIVDSIEFSGASYIAVTPYLADEEEETDSETEEVEFTILREVVPKEGEPFLEDIDDEGLYQKIGEMFLKQFEAKFGTS
jgi:hypothetical protein